MIDISILRDSPDLLKAALVRKGSSLDVDLLAELDASVRKLRHAADGLRAEQKAAGKQIAALPKDEKQGAIAAAAALSERQKDLSKQADEVESEFNELWMQVPNPAHASAADGLHEADSAEVSRWGEPRVFDFEVKDHQDLGEEMDIIDVAAGVAQCGRLCGRQHPRPLAGLEQPRDVPLEVEEIPPHLGFLLLGDRCERVEL